MTVPYVIQNNNSARPSLHDHTDDDQEERDTLRNSARVSRNLHTTDSTMDPSCRYVSTHNVWSNILSMGLDDTLFICRLQNWDLKKKVLDTLAWNVH